MDHEVNQLLSWLATQYAAANYDYLWLKTMLGQAQHAAPPDSTLIVGSSHALNAVREGAWKHAFNCSMHSQDLYYDFLCARHVLTAAKGGTFRRCLIVMGYYVAYQDLSLSSILRDIYITNIYHPIFRDAHNWDGPAVRDPWAEFGDIPQEVRDICESAIVRDILQYGTYYSPFRLRKTLFDWKGRTWAQLSEGERLHFGQIRAQEHNKLFRYKSSFEENKRILGEFVHFLHECGVQPIVVVTPFADEYNRFVLPAMKAGTLELIDSVPEDVHYVDFNQALDLFDPSDFMDTDHLSERGAEKVSRILAEMFGE